jgi:RNA recognition motif-containing protein
MGRPSLPEEAIRMLKMYVGNLPAETTEDDVAALFADYGRVRSLRLARDVFSGQCRGFGFVEMEGHEARAAIAGLDGRDFKGKQLRVNEERPKKNRRRGRR